MGFPATGLVVVLDNEPETVLEIEFDRKERAFVVYVVSFLIPYVLQMDPHFFSLLRYRYLSVM